MFYGRLTAADVGGSAAKDLRFALKRRIRLWPLIDSQYLACWNTFARTTLERDTLRCVNAWEGCRTSPGHFEPAGIQAGTINPPRIQRPELRVPGRIRS